MKIYFLAIQNAAILNYVNIIHNQLAILPGHIILQCLDLCNINSHLMNFLVTKINGNQSKHTQCYHKVITLEKVYGVANSGSSFQGYVYLIRFLNKCTLKKPTIKEK